MKKYYVEITRKSGGVCVFASIILAPSAVVAEHRARKMADIPKDDRYLYDMYIEIK